ncbi:MAG: hypothetical protein AAFP76_08610 [Bacteroidota bacterium]
MKKSFLLVAVISAFLFACEADSPEIQTEAEVDLTSPQTIELSQFSPVRGQGGGLTPSEELEKSMDWASYTLAYVLFETPSYKIQLTTHLNGSKTISLEDLLGATPVIPNLKSDFLSTFQQFVDACSSSGLGGGCPGDGSSPGDPECPPCEGFTNQGAGNILISYLIEQNCTELYLPRGIVSTSNVITSTAHPLDTGSAYHNTGNERYAISLSGSPDVGVTPNYVNIHNHTILVVRPFRNLSETDCLYSQYSDINFTDFLQGSW